MRAILVSWLVEVHSKYDLRPETLYITVNMVDRYCEKRRVPRAEYQLLGVTAMFIACKYEEITPPKIAEFVDISDHTYSKQAMLRQEFHILRELNYDITFPTTFRFLERFSNLVGVSPEVYSLA